jgi:hypothetical protein
MAVRAKPQDLFAADSDVAALVYRPGDDPDAVLDAFVASLVADGFDPIGLLQRRNGPAVDFVPMPDAGTVEALSAATPALLDAVRRRPDLLVVNRFGSAELSGGGLLSVLIEAVRLDVPVLIAVPQALFSDWLVFSGGLTIRMDCRRNSLDRWWASLSKPTLPRFQPQTICEQMN